LATIRNATRILVFEAGRIIESGSFDELVSKGGHFAKLARTQFMVTEAPSPGSRKPSPLAAATMSPLPATARPSPHPAKARILFAPGQHRLPSRKFPAEFSLQSDNVPPRLCDGNARIERGRWPLAVAQRGARSQEGP